MRLLYHGPEGAQEVSIDGCAVASVGELAEVLGLPSPIDGLWVDDQWMEANRGLDEAGVADGVRVGVRPGPVPDQPGWVREVVGGLSAGDRHSLPAEGLSLGRSPDADLTLPHVGLRPHHARLERRY